MSIVFLFLKYLIRDEVLFKVSNLICHVTSISKILVHLWELRQLHSAILALRRRQRLLRQRGREGLPADHVLGVTVQVQQPEAVHPRVVQVWRNSRLRRRIRRARVSLGGSKSVHRQAIQVWIMFFYAIVVGLVIARRLSTTPHTMNLAWRWYTSCCIIILWCWNVTISRWIMSMICIVALSY